MLPIISSTAAEASVTPRAWTSTICFIEPILEIISFTALAVWSTLRDCAEMLFPTLSILARICVIEETVSWVLSLRFWPAFTRVSFDCFITRIMSWSFAENVLNPSTTPPISSFEWKSIRFVKSAFPDAISVIFSLTDLSGARLRARRIPLAIPTAINTRANTIILRSICWMTAIAWFLFWMTPRYQTPLFIGVYERYQSLPDWRYTARPDFPWIIRFSTRTSSSIEPPVRASGLRKSFSSFFLPE